MKKVFACFLAGILLLTMTVFPAAAAEPETAETKRSCAHVDTETEVSEYWEKNDAQHRSVKESNTVCIECGTILNVSLDTSPWESHNYSGTIFISETHVGTYDTHKHTFKRQCTDCRHIGYISISAGCKQSQCNYYN